MPDVFSTFLKTVRGEEQGGGGSSGGREATPEEVQRALLKLLKMTGPQPVKQLLELSQTNFPVLMDVLDRLEKYGLVKIGPDASSQDTVVKITESGLQNLESM
ncbi:MAG: hypothetical protein WCB68_16880 [Pyrinomonadaceae bacterium]